MVYWANRSAIRQKWHNQRAILAIHISGMVSLIISTRNRCQPLRQCLESIRQLESPAGGWEFIVVYTPAADATGEVIEEYGRAWPVAMKVVLEMRPGLGLARNSGIAAATGDLIVFTDDDCYPEPDFLVQMERVFAEDPKLGYAGGRILLYDPTDYPVDIHPSEEREEIPPYHLFAPGELSGANMAFRRQAIEETGGFDPLLGAGARMGGEDLDFFATVSAAGWRGVYDPQPTIYHHHGRKAADVERLHLGHIFGNGAFLGKCLVWGRLPKMVYLKTIYWTLARMIERKQFARAKKTVHGALRYIFTRGVAMPLARLRKASRETAYRPVVTEYKPQRAGDQL
jgi:glycosyltransferase involved in cell wall biosynthesis